MKLSTKSRYGARAILEIAKTHKNRPIKRKEIVEAQHIPDSYLENILVTLKAAGLINTIRGAQGGYTLTRNPEEITLFDVVQALEGTIYPVPCIESGNCDLAEICTTKGVWGEMYEAIHSVLSKYTLQKIVEMDVMKDPFIYTI